MSRATPGADAIARSVAQVRETMMRSAESGPPLNVEVLLHWCRRGRLPMDHVPIERMHAMIVRRTLDSLTPLLRQEKVVRGTAS